MHSDWLEKIPACKICTNKRNTERCAIIRLSSNGRTRAEFKLISSATHKTGLLHLFSCTLGRAEAWGQLRVAFSPPSSSMEFSVSSSTSAFSMETSWTFLGFSFQGSIGKQCNGPLELRFRSQANHKPLRSVCSCIAGCGILLPASSLDFFF